MNAYYLAAGILSVLISLMHAVWGELRIIKELNASSAGKATATGFYISYHQITAVLLAAGIALMVAAAGAISGNALPMFITILICADFGVFLLISAIKQRRLLVQSIPQIALFSILILLLLLGIYS